MAMQPDSDVKFDRKSFDIIKRTIKNISLASRGRKRDNGFATQLPVIVGLKLTNRCNLRCVHCYEWNSDGYHRNMSGDMQHCELDSEIVQRIMAETREVKSGLYLWGGEPLYYAHIDFIAGLLENDPRITAVCTNGILIEEKTDALLKMGESLELLIALDGFEQENDAIRGKNTFGKVVSAIQLLRQLREKQLFRGKVSVHCVINEKTAPRLFDFLVFLEQAGVDSVIVCYPWFISPESSKEMTRFFEQNFGFLNPYNSAAPHSWDAFKYNLDTATVPVLRDEARKIASRIWKLRVKYQPALAPDQIQDFLEGKHIAAQGREECLSVSTRMDVLPDGSVTSCKHFPEFAVGNLHDMSVHEIWNCNQFRKIREVLAGKLMPVCSKCNNLYLHGK